MGKRASNAFVCFDSIKVNAIETNSGIFVGTNTQFNWNTSSNIKSGFGVLIGKQNTVGRNINIVHDDDFIDTPIKATH